MDTLKDYFNQVESNQLGHRERCRYVTTGNKKFCNCNYTIEKVTILKTNYKYWLMNIIHNIFFHPFMPLADLLLVINYVKAANYIYGLHEKTTPTRWLK